MNLEKSLLAYKQKAQPEPTEEKYRKPSVNQKKFFLLRSRKEHYPTVNFYGHNLSSYKKNGGSSNY